MAVLLALIAALAYGVSDFAAGLMSRGASVFIVTLIAQVAAAVVVSAAIPFAGGSVDGPTLVWASIAGLGGAGGAMFLYRGLARGNMSIVGPVSAVVTAAGSAAAGVVMGERPTPITGIGVVLACAAVALVSMSKPSDRVPIREGWLALFNAAAAGGGFVVLFVGLHQTGTTGGLWPVAVATYAEVLVALGAAALALARGHEQLASFRRVFGGSVVTGILGSTATVAFFVATHRGLLAVTGVITSLYPATTVLLALVMLRESVRRRQALGLGITAIAVALLSVSQP